MRSGAHATLEAAAVEAIQLNEDQASEWRRSGKNREALVERRLDHRRLRSGKVVGVRCRRG